MTIEQPLGDPEAQETPGPDNETRWVALGGVSLHVSPATAQQAPATFTFSGDILTVG